MSAQVKASVTVYRSAVLEFPLISVRAVVLVCVCMTIFPWLTGQAKKKKMFWTITALELTFDP